MTHQHNDKTNIQTEHGSQDRSAQERAPYDHPESADRHGGRRKAGQYIRDLFVPTGHTDLDQLRRDGLAAGAPWYSTVAAGMAAGLALAVAVLFIYMTYALSAAAIVWALESGIAARELLAGRLQAAAPYARYLWLSGLAAGVVGAAYALLRRRTVLREYYVRIGPWEIGAHTLFGAVAGYAGLYVAASLWPPLAEIHRYLFWAWGPIIAWFMTRLQDAFILVIVRPDWRLSVESAVHVLMPRRFGCPRERLQVTSDAATRTVTVAATIAVGEVERARELIQAIPETQTVQLQPLPAAGLETGARSVPTPM